MGLITLQQNNSIPQFTACYQEIYMAKTHRSFHITEYT